MTLPFSKPPHCRRLATGTPEEYRKRWENSTRGKEMLKDIEEAIKLRNLGVSILQISKVIGRSRLAIRRHFLKQKITIIRPATKVCESEIIKAYLQRKDSDRTLCERFGIGRKAMYGIFKRNGIDRKGKKGLVKYDKADPRSKFWKNNFHQSISEMKKRVRQCLNKKAPKLPVLKKPRASREQVLERMRIRAKREYYEKRHDSEWKRKRKETTNAWKIKNPKKLKDCNTRWRNSNPEKMRGFRKKQRQKPVNKIRRALKKRIKELCGNPNQFSQTIGCSGRQLLNHLERQFTGTMSWKNYGKWHIDHIIPCAKFDHTDRDQVLICWNWQNLRPLWAKANIKKSDRVPLPQMHLPLVLMS